MPSCPRCGAEVDEGQRYCSNCGHDLRREQSPGRDLVLGLAALAGFGLATVGLQALLDKLLAGQRTKRE